MVLRFLHLSDIHFGQEKDGTLITHDFVRDELSHPSLLSELKRRPSRPQPFRRSPLRSNLDHLNRFEHSMAAIHGSVSRRLYKGELLTGDFDLGCGALQKFRETRKGAGGELVTVQVECARPGIQSPRASFGFEVDTPWLAGRRGEGRPVQTRLS